MTRAALLSLALLVGCTSTLSIGGRTVPVHFVYDIPRGLERREVRILQKEVDRAEALDGAEYKWPPTEVIHWGHRRELPFSYGHWFVGYWWAQNGESILHVNNVRVLRHELHHARTGPGHEGPKWEEIENERFNHD